MKLDFLKTLQEVQPCGLRAVIEPLDESYPVVAFSDWKELAVQLIDACFVKRMGNGQYIVTPAGKEAIAQGEEFLEQALGSEQTVLPENVHVLSHEEAYGTSEPEVKSTGEEERQEQPSSSKQTDQAPDTTVEETKAHAKQSATAESISDSLSFSERTPKHDVPMKFYAWTTKSDLEKVDTDELLSRHQVLKEHLDEIKSVVNQRINSAFYPSTQRESSHV